VRLLSAGVSRARADDVNIRLSIAHFMRALGDAVDTVPQYRFVRLMKYNTSGFKSNKDGSSVITTTRTKNQNSRDCGLRVCPTGISCITSPSID
jgi:hypothetical protein